MPVRKMNALIMCHLGGETVIGPLYPELVKPPPKGTNVMHFAEDTAFWVMRPLSTRVAAETAAAGEIGDCGKMAVTHLTMAMALGSSVTRLCSIAVFSQSFFLVLSYF